MAAATAAVQQVQQVHYEATDAKSAATRSHSIPRAMQFKRQSEERMASSKKSREQSPEYGRIPEECGTERGCSSMWKISVNSRGEPTLMVGLDDDAPERSLARRHSVFNQAVPPMAKYPQSTAATPAHATMPAKRHHPATLYLKENTPTQSPAQKTPKIKSEVHAVSRPPRPVSWYVEQLLYKLFWKNPR